MPITAALVQVDATGQPSGAPLATATHPLTTSPLNVTATWPTSVRRGASYVFRMRYINPADASYSHDGYYFTQAPKDKGDASWETTIAPNPDKPWDATFQWSWNSTGPWNNATNRDNYINAYRFPSKPFSPHSTQQLWVRMTVHQTTASSIRLRYGWWHGYPAGSDHEAWPGWYPETVLHVLSEGQPAAGNPTTISTPHPRTANSTGAPAVSTSASPGSTPFATVGIGDEEGQSRRHDDGIPRGLLALALAVLIAVAVAATLAIRRFGTGSPP